MSLNGSGVAVINSAGQPVVATTLITAVAFNALTADLTTMLSTCVMKDGQQTITQNLPFNNKKITGLAAGTARTDGASLATIQDGTGVYVATVAGSSNAIELTPSPAIAAYAAGQEFEFVAAADNTSTVTVAVSGLATKAIVNNAGDAVSSGDIQADAMVRIRYNGTAFVLCSLFNKATTWTPAVGGSATYTTQLGAYIRIGRVVHFNCVLTINSIGTGSTSVISGLPFAAINDQAVAVGGVTTSATAVVSVNAYVAGSSTTIQLVGREAAAVSSSVIAIFGNATQVIVSGSYFTAS